MTPQERDERDARLADAAANNYVEDCMCAECITSLDIRSLLAEARELREALEAAVERLRDHRSYYIADNRLGLNPTADEEVQRTDKVIARARRALGGGR